MITILQGDVIEQLRTLPDESVHCCVTSPPYWGLRDYGTAQWEGGDNNCDHSSGEHAWATATEQAKKRVDSGMPFRGDCGKCGAKRIDSQLGLEKTPEEYVAKMVEVFREVRRVLRRDGTLWLNLGSSYASGDMQPNQSRSDVPACGSGDTELQDSQNAGRVCLDSCDESQDETQNHRDRNARNEQSASLNERPLSQTSRDSERTDSVSASATASPRGVRASNTRASWRRDRAACVPAAKASESREAARSSSRNAQASGRNSWVNNPMFSQQFKPKDMVPIPWMVAMALQADGWWLRSDIIWAKPNPMPESCTDRPTKAHEYLFLLTKSANYFYDAEAIKERSLDPEDDERRMRQSWENGKDKHRETSISAFYAQSDLPRIPTGNRNKRSVWTVATAPYPEAHFATYPPDLIKPCILAGTSAKGCCAKCGSPWERIVEDSEQYAAFKKSENDRKGRGMRSSDLETMGLTRGTSNQSISAEKKTIGWQPTCACSSTDLLGNQFCKPIAPCTVLDPFAGSGTTGAVALELGRKAVLIELNPKYVELIERRCSVTMGLPLAV